MRMSPKKRKISADLVLWAAMAAVGAALFLVLALFGKTGDRVDVFVKGELVMSCDPREDLLCRIDGDGGFNILVIKNGEVSIEDADCPDKLCAKSGAIKKAGQSIICLPHKVVVEMASDAGLDDDVDYVIGGK